MKTRAQDWGEAVVLASLRSMPGDECLLSERDRSARGPAGMVAAGTCAR
jgi:hypothetical protein